MNMEYRTQRLILKVLNTDHLREVLQFQMRNKDIFEKYEPTRPENFLTLSYQHSVVKHEYKLTMNLSTVRFYVFRREDPRTIIGTVCLHDIIRGAYHCAELGYKVDEAHWHQGYASEALQEMLRIAFVDLQLHRLFARVVPDNTPSIRLLQRLGFHEEGLEEASIQIQGKWTDHLRFALICPSA